MAKQARQKGPMTQASSRLSPRAGYLLLVGITLLALAWLVRSAALAGMVLLVTGLSLLFLALLTRLLARRGGPTRTDLLEAIPVFYENDAAPCFATDKDGAITYRNQAATSEFDGEEGISLAHALGDLFASPAALLFRLQSRAQARGSASEDVVLRRGNMRLSVHLLGEDAYLWRLESLGDRGISGRSGETISLPMMTVSRTGTILYMNEPLRRLLGGRETALDRVVTSLPIAHGAAAMLAGKDGPVEATVCEIVSSAGRRELYFLPELNSSLVSPEDWGVIEGLPVPLLKLDGEGEVRMANRRARDLLADENVVGTRLSDQVEGLGRPVSEWLREAMAGRNLGRSEVVRAVKPEAEIYLQISLAQVAEADGRALVAVLQDATALKTLEAQFVQSQKMQAIGQLAGGVAHDFNNLLTAISGHCDLLLLRHDAGDPEFADLDQIRQNANRAAALVGQLLAFSRKQTLRPEAVDIEDSLSDLVHLLNRLMGERTQLVVSHGGEILPIRADKRQLEQVLMNLVVNARDAMPDGGEIRIETNNLSLAEPLCRDRATVPPGDYVSIRVIDRGCGIAPDKLGKIFEPFFTTKRTGHGTGLGLSMAYGIVKQTGGYIFVDSEVGKGSTFTLMLPICTDKNAKDPGAKLTSQERPVSAVDEENAGAPAVPDSCDPDQGSLPGEIASDPVEETTAADPMEQTPEIEALLAGLEAVAEEVDGEESAGEVQDDLPRPTHDLSRKGAGNVLLVEDEAPVRAFAARALRMRGYTVLEAESAEDALKVLEDSRLNIDVFVTDVIMPGMDGPTWVAKALEARPGVKVVFVSGYAEDAVSEHQARIPNSVFLPKPFSLSELTATVQQQFH